jgi:hypothetical protein
VRTTVVLAIALGVSLASVAWSLWHRPRTVPVPAMRVEVLNGCGENQLASRVATALRSWGLDVVAVGDASRHDHVESLLVDRAGKPALTRRLAEELGDVQVVLERLEEPRADATLILGADYRRMGLLD